MASVTNLKLRDGVGTVVPVEAFGGTSPNDVFFCLTKNGCQHGVNKKLTQPNLARFKGVYGVSIASG